MTDTVLVPLTSALGRLSDAELVALREAVQGVSSLPPGFSAWLEHVIDWEASRRTGLAFLLQPPEAAIPPEEDADSIASSMAIRQKFALDSRTEASATIGLFDAVITLLVGEAHKH